MTMEQELLYKDKRKIKKKTYFIIGILFLLLGVTVLFIPKEDSMTTQVTEAPETVNEIRSYAGNIINQPTNINITSSGDYEWIFKTITLEFDSNNDGTPDVFSTFKQINENKIEVTVDDSIEKGNYKWKSAICNYGNVSWITAEQYNPNTDVWTNTGNLSYGNLVNYGMPSSWCNQTNGQGFVLFGAGSGDKTYRLNLPNGPKELKVYTGEGTEQVIATYQETNKIQYDGSFFQCNWTLQAQNPNQTVNDIFITTKNGDYAFGGRLESDKNLTMQYVGECNIPLKRDKQDFYVETKENIGINKKIERHFFSTKDVCLVDTKKDYNKTLIVNALQSGDYLNNNITVTDIDDVLSNGTIIYSNITQYNVTRTFTQIKKNNICTFNNNETKQIISFQGLTNGTHIVIDPTISVSTQTDWNAGNFTNNTYALLNGDLIASWGSDKALDNVVSTTNLNGYWKLNGDENYGENDTHIYDYSGNGNNGTIINQAISTTGIIQGGYEFNGSNYITTPNQVLSTDVTVSLWIYRDAVTGTTRVFGQGGRFYMESRVGNTLRVYTVGVTDNILNIGGVISDEWTHIAFTYNGTDKIGYKNGVETIREVTSGTIGQVNNSFSIGSSGAGTLVWEGGKLDEFAFFNRALNSTEISDIYNAQSPRYPEIAQYETEIFNAVNSTSIWNNYTWNGNNQSMDIRSLVSTNNLSYYYRFENNSAYGSNETLIGDWSGNGNNLTLVTNTRYDDNGLLSTQGLYQEDNGGRADFPSNSDVDVGLNEEFAFGGWYKINGTDGTAFIVDKRGSRGYQLYTAGNLQKCRFDGTSGNKDVDFNVNISDGEWHHLVCGRNTTHMYAYVDGVNTNSLADSTLYDLTDASYPFTFGSIYGGTLGTGGFYDEQFFFKRTLSEAEINTIYNNQKNTIRTRYKTCNDSACSGESWSGYFNESPVNMGDEVNQYAQIEYSFYSPQGLETSTVSNLNVEMMNATVGGGPSQCWADLGGGTVYVPDTCTYYIDTQEYIT